MRNYREELRTEEWKRKRSLIMNRDGYKCMKCGSKLELQVHHKYYLVGKKAWQYPSEVLITLCDSCHLKEHKYNIIPVLNTYKKKKKKEKASTPKTNISKRYDYMKRSGKIADKPFEMKLYKEHSKKRKRSK
jgi:5-methylcytosine-specific restriction endonuclease McrA